MLGTKGSSAGGTRTQRPSPVVGDGQEDNPWIIKGRLRVSDVWGQTHVSLDTTTEDAESVLARTAAQAGVREILLQLQVDRANATYERLFTGVVTKDGKIACPMKSGELGLSTLLVRRVGVGRRIRLIAWKKSGQALDDVEDDALLRTNLAEVFASFMSKVLPGNTFSLKDIIPRKMRSRIVMYRLRLLAREAVGRGQLQIHANGRRRLYAKPVPRVSSVSASS